jgi:hypothetical protein
MKFSGKWRAFEAQELRDYCMASAYDRGDFYQKMRHGFRYGSRDVSQGRHNKIKPIIKQLASFMYAPETVAFWPKFPADEFDQLDKSEALSELMNDAWEDTGVNLYAYSAVEEALICGSGFVSLLPERMTDGGVTIVARIVPAERVGVFREDVNEMALQQAVAWETYVTRQEFEPRLAFLPAKERAKVLASMESIQLGHTETDRVFVANYSGPSSGNNTEMGLVMSRLGGGYHYNPYMATELYKVTNLFAYDDDLGDWNWFLLSGPNVIGDMPLSRIGVSGMVPLCLIQADMIPGFFYGYSQVDGLGMLQDWQSKRLVQMDDLWEKILAPPKVGYGMGQMRESKANAMNRARSFTAIPNPNSKVEELRPELPEIALTMLELMDGMFLEAAELQEEQFGKTQPGMRTRGMQQSALRVGASPTRVKAMCIEKSLQNVATLLLRLKQRFDPGLYPVYDDNAQFTGNLFRCGELSDHVTMKVDGNSASPLFMDDKSRMAEILFKAGAMDGETLIQFVRPPQMELLLKRQKRRNQAQLVAQAVQKLKQQQKRIGDAEK